MKSILCITLSFLLFSDSFAYPIKESAEDKKIRSESFGDGVFRAIEDGDCGIYLNRSQKLDSYLLLESDGIPIVDFLRDKDDYQEGCIALVKHLYEKYGASLVVKRIYLRSEDGMIRICVLWGY